jgi:hypothetical protein
VVGTQCSAPCSIVTAGPFCPPFPPPASDWGAKNKEPPPPSPPPLMLGGRPCVVLSIHTHRAIYQSTHSSIQCRPKSPWWFPSKLLPINESIDQLQSIVLLAPLLLAVQPPSGRGHCRVPPAVSDTKNAVRRRPTIDWAAAWRDLT